MLVITTFSRNIFLENRIKEKTTKTPLYTWKKKCPVGINCGFVDFQLILSIFTTEQRTEKRMRCNDGCILEEVSARHANLLTDTWDPTIWFWNLHDSLFSTLSTGLFLYRVLFAVKRDRKLTIEDWGIHHPKQEEMSEARTGTACAYSLAHAPASWTTEASGCSSQGLR